MGKMSTDIRDIWLIFRTHKSLSSINKNIYDLLNVLPTAIDSLFLTLAVGRKLYFFIFFSFPEN